MKELLFFSHNQKKIEEINKIFTSNITKIHNLNSFKNIQEPKETGETFSANAKIKSSYGQKKFNMPCFADDSGFCVEALNDKPGVQSKRFLEKFSSDSDAFEYIIANVRKKNNDNEYPADKPCHRPELAGSDIRHFRETVQALYGRCHAARRVAGDSPLLELRPHDSML